MERFLRCNFYFTDCAKYTKTVKGNHDTLGTLIFYSRSSNYRKQKIVAVLLFKKNSETRNFVLEF